MYYRLALLLAMATLLAACGGGDPTHAPAAATADAAASVLRRGNGGEPGSLDPALAEDVHAFAILADLFEGLVTTDAAGRVIPGVARQWSVSDDGLQYRFTLRRDARWSNGDRVLAADFVRAFQHVADPRTLSSYAFLVDAIAGFDAVKAGSGSVDTLGVDAPDDETLLITLERPAPYWLSILTMPIASPRPPDAAAVTNGAYMLESRNALGVTRLTRNPYFHAAGSVNIDAVEYYPIADELAELNRFRAGELDLTQAIPPNQLAILRESMPEAVRIAPMLGLYYLAFDLSEPPFDKLDLRQALSLAIDRQAIARVLGRGEIPAFGIVPPGVAGYEGTDYDWADLEKAARDELARSHYARAGFSKDRTLSMTILYDSGGVHESIAVAVADMWRQTLGVEVTLDKREWMYFLQAREDTAEWQAMRFSWLGDFDDPATFLDIFRSDNAQNLPGYANLSYDSLLSQADEEQNRNERHRLLQEAEDAVLADYPIAPLYFYVSKHLVADRVRGYEDNALDRHPTRFLRFVE